MRDLTGEATQSQVYSTAEYCAPLWSRSYHTVVHVLSGILSPELKRQATLREWSKINNHATLQDLPIQYETWVLLIFTENINRLCNLDRRYTK